MESRTKSRSQFVFCTFSGSTIMIYVWLAVEPATAVKLRKASRQVGSVFWDHGEKTQFNPDPTKCVMHVQSWSRRFNPDPIF